jgi:luciferase family oxidoreductase group 1
VLEVIAYFRHPEPGDGVRAVPGAGLDVPVWILGSSLFGAQLAAAFGLPYAFASHFAPAQMTEALELYRSRFRPSEQLAQPYVMLGINVFAADSAGEARLLSTSWQQAFVNLRRGRPGSLPPPRADLESELTPWERSMLEDALACSAIGDPGIIRNWLKQFIARTGADELMVAGQIFDHPARRRSYEIAAEARDALAGEEHPDAAAARGAAR